MLFNCTGTEQHSSATAIVSVSAGTGSVHAMILMGDQMFDPDEKDNVMLKVSFESFHNGEHRLIEENLEN